MPDLYGVTQYESGWYVEKPDYSKPIEDGAFIQVAGPYKREDTAQRKCDALNFLAGEHLATMPAPQHDHSRGAAFCPHCSPRIGS
jgi:hypothetical protein